MNTLYISVFLSHDTKQPTFVHTSNPTIACMFLDVYPNSKRLKIDIPNLEMIPTTDRTSIIATNWKDLVADILGKSL